MPLPSRARVMSRRSSIIRLAGRLAERMRLAVLICRSSKLVALNKSDEETEIALIGFRRSWLTMPISCCSNSTRFFTSFSRKLCSEISVVQPTQSSSSPLAQKKSHRFRQSINVNTIIPAQPITTLVAASRRKRCVPGIGDQGMVFRMDRLDRSPPFVLFPGLTGKTLPGGVFSDDRAGLIGPLHHVRGGFDQGTKPCLDVGVKTGTGSKFEDTLFGIDRPNAREGSTQPVDHRLGAALQHVPHRRMVGECGADISTEGRLLSVPCLQFFRPSIVLIKSSVVDRDRGPTCKLVRQPEIAGFKSSSTFSPRQSDCSEHPATKRQGGDDVRSQAQLTQQMRELRTFGSLSPVNFGHVFLPLRQQSPDHSAQSKIIVLTERLNFRQP